MLLKILIVLSLSFSYLMPMEQPVKYKHLKELFGFLEPERELFDIVRDTWVKFNKVLLQEYNNKECLGPDYNGVVRIRRKDVYVPSDLQSDAKLFWLVVHGTWGRDTKSFYDDESPGFPNYGYIKEAAAWYATQSKRPIELLSIEWSGGLSHAARKALGNAIAHFVDKVNDGNNTVILAHSHGCNGSSYASRKINPQKPIALLIYFACPRRPEEYYQPLHYKQLIHFHSSADFVAPLGRIPEERNTEFGLSTIPVLPYITTHVLYNLSKILTGLSEVDRSAIKWIWRVSHFFSICYLARHISGDNWLFPDNENKITQNLLTTLDNKSPTHSTIVDAVKFLPLILDKLLDKSPRYSIAFDLNVAMNKDHNDHTSVLMREHFTKEKPATKPIWCTVI